MRIFTLLFVALCFFSCGSDSGSGNKGNTNTGNNNSDKPETPRPPQEVIDSYITDLEAMAGSARQIEAQINNSRNNPGSEEAEYDLFLQQEKTDSVNMVRLAKMLDEHGWIARSVYGNKTSDQALAILNKGSSNHHVYYFSMLSKSFANGEVKPSGFAEIYDKAMVAQGRNQLYGTQLSFNEADGTNYVHPMDDEANVDKRRRMVGLEPMTAYWEKFGIVYPKGGSATDH